jgi:hypothetical protein
MLRSAQNMKIAMAYKPLFCRHAETLTVICMVFYNFIGTVPTVAVSWAGTNCAATHEVSNEAIFAAVLRCTRAGLISKENDVALLTLDIVLLAIWYSRALLPSLWLEVLMYSSTLLT